MILSRKQNIFRSGAILAVAMIMLTLSGACTTNNGDIGRYYGVWALDEVTVGGVSNSDWCPAGTWVNWQFQNNIICIARYDGLHDSDTGWGTWSADEKILTLDFTHSDSTFPSGTGTYAPPSGLFLDSKVTRLDILKADNRSMILGYTDADGKQIVYYLRKTY